VQQRHKSRHSNDKLVVTINNQQRQLPKTDLVCSLYTVQSLVVVCAVCAHLGGPAFLGGESGCSRNTPFPRVYYHTKYRQSVSPNFVTQCQTVWAHVWRSHTFGEVEAPPHGRWDGSVTGSTHSCLTCITTIKIITLGLFKLHSLRNSDEHWVNNAVHLRLRGQVNGKTWKDVVDKDMLDRESCH